MIRLACVLCAFTSASSLAAARARKPNILWLISNDNSPLLGCYGDTRAHTPRLDQLASHGVLYLNAFANASTDGPSRSTLDTGVYASTLGTLHTSRNVRLPSDTRDYWQTMRQAGYYCMNGEKPGNPTTWDAGARWKDAPAGKPWLLVLHCDLTAATALDGSVMHPKALKAPLALPAYLPDSPMIRSNQVEYDQDITKMDAWMGAQLDQLSKDGFADDTVVIYCSSHGGVLPRSIGFLYDSGLRVPLIVRFGKHFQDQSPAAPGSKLDRVVSLVDLAPTLLSLADVAPAPLCQGAAFLGPRAQPRRQYAFGFRGRFDERYDLIYTERDQRYRYIRNYMPDRIQAQHIDRLWKLPAMAAWDGAYHLGVCNGDQSAFWQIKPSEELYDEQLDPDEVKNLADYPTSRALLERMRQALRRQLLANRDPGILPEPQMIQRAGNDAVYTMTHDAARYPVERILDAADVASSRDPQSVPQLIAWMKDADPAVRYWAATGCSVRGDDARDAADALLELLKDPVPSVRIAAGEALCRINRPRDGLAALVRELNGKPLNVLMAQNALESLGPEARPAGSAIAAKVAAWPDAGKNKNCNRAAESLLLELGAISHVPR